MIQKIEKIENLAVFQNFVWDDCVKTEDGTAQEFRPINIIYGRNYSGKTSLSRILRAFETGHISEKYDHPRFSLKLADGTVLNEANLQNHSLALRVFNEDFVRENLRFIVNPEEDIEPFAVLGADNNKLESEIQELEKELGSEEQSKETRLYANRVQMEKDATAARTAHQQAETDLNRQLTQKATSGEDAIKYKASKFGDQNYNITKLKSELASVSEESYQPHSTERIKELENLLNERALSEIPKLPAFESKLSEFSDRAKTLLQKQIGKSDKIQELLTDAVLNRWVHEGRTIHKDNRETCGFCGNQITSERWAELDRHFDKESEEFERELDALIEQIETEKKRIGSTEIPDKQLFYQRFHARFDARKKSLDACIQGITQGLDALRSQLKERRDALLMPRDYEPVTDRSEELQRVLNELETLRSEANAFTDKLQKEQSNARYDLRLQEVWQFSNTIEYSKKLRDIEALATKKQEAENALRRVNDEIETKKRSIAEKKRQLNDEEEGARKVNAYLTQYFEHHFFKLKAQEKNDPETGEKKIRFQVMRGDHVAHHLSEGECRLLAFCYFMAKLEDTETKGLNPIIWIDDPISSLDGNHVFFVYSLQKAKIIEEGIFKQLFISTHNLDFLKYLKRFRGTFVNNNGRNQEYDRRFFILHRSGLQSDLQLMPKHLKDYVTEFNFLFHQIYKCASVSEDDAAAETVFYNFGNNARKFLEIFLYYRFPDSSSDLEKLERFFGQGMVPPILTDRINNEYSHLCGGLERGSLPVVVPEMKTVANKIIDCLKRDRGQFNALLKSIGEDPLPADTTANPEAFPQSVDSK